MNRLLATALAAVAGLAVAGPVAAQDDSGSNLPFCSAKVTDHCRQREGSDAMPMHKAAARHHARTTHARHHRKAAHRKAAHRTAHHAAHSRNAHAATPATPATPAKPAKKM